MRRGAHGFEVVLARSILRGRPRLVQRGQQHRREDRDDRDHDQEFDQGELADSDTGSIRAERRIFCVYHHLFHGIDMPRQRDRLQRSRNHSKHFFFSSLKE